MVSIGDYSVINRDVCLQTHTYEDRIIKVGKISIGSGVSIGSQSNILHNTSIGDLSHIKPLSVLMTGETVSAHSVCTGIPCAPIAIPDTPMKDKDKDKEMVKEMGQEML